MEQHISTDKKFIVIQNDGIVTEEMLTILGVSTKRDTNSIGEWGSGFKHSLSYLAQHDIKFRILSGDHEFDIKYQDLVITDSNKNTIETKRIIIDGNKTSLSSTWSHKWDLWMVIREIISNSMDAGNMNIYYDVPANTICTEENVTSVCLEQRDDILDVIKNKEGYYFKFDLEPSFSFDMEPDLSIGIYKHSKAQDRHSPVLYRKGILVSNTNQKAMFHYDFSYLNINESRLYNDRWQVLEYISSLYCRFANIEMLDKLFNVFKLANNSSFIEVESVANYMSYEFSETWVDAIGGRTIIPKEFSGLFASVDMEMAILLPMSVVTCLSKSNIKNRLVFAESFAGDNAKLEVGGEEVTGKQKDVYNTLITLIPDINSMFNLNIEHIKLCKYFNSIRNAELDTDSKNTIWINVDCIDSGYFMTKYDYGIRSNFKTILLKDTFVIPEIATDNWIKVCNLEMIIAGILSEYHGDTKVRQLILMMFSNTLSLQSDIDEKL